MPVRGLDDFVIDCVSPSAITVEEGANETVVEECPTGFSFAAVRCRAARAAADALASAQASIDSVVDSALNSSVLATVTEATTEFSDAAAEAAANLGLLNSTTTEDANSTNGTDGTGVDVAGAPPPPRLIFRGVPDANVEYQWSNGVSTYISTNWGAPLRIALNAVDFRGDILFTYYHQVLTDVKCSDSSEFSMSYGGSPEGGYEVTLVGTGFDGYDQNASTARVRFLSSKSVNDVASALAARNLTNTSAANASLVAAVGDGVDWFEVAGVRLGPTQLVVRAPRVTLDRGELITDRGYPCWNPPCRRVYLSLALNGVDFVGKAEPLEFIYLVDPSRWLYLMDEEFWRLAYVLSVLFFVNLGCSWFFRFQYYDRYLRLKYYVKNNTIWR